MTIIQLPNGYSAKIEEGTFTMNAMGLEYSHMVTVRKACGRVDTVMQCDTLADCMVLLSEY